MNSFEDLLKMALMDSLKKDEAPMSRNEAISMMEKYQELTKNQIKEGDYIERNDFGRSRYKIPDEGRNQVAVCAKRYSEPKMDEHGNMCDMLMIATIRKDTVIQFLVDSACYQKAAEKKNIVNLFRRKDS